MALKVDMVSRIVMAMGSKYRIVVFVNMRTVPYESTVPHGSTDNVPIPLDCT